MAKLFSGILSDFLPMKIRWKLLLALLLASGAGVLAADVEIIAHRGASYDAPENTLESVRLAGEQKADAVEVDVFSRRTERWCFITMPHQKIAGVDRKVCGSNSRSCASLMSGVWKALQVEGVRNPQAGRRAGDDSGWQTDVCRGEVWPGGSSPRWVGRFEKAASLPNQPCGSVSTTRS